MELYGLHFSIFELISVAVLFVAFGHQLYFYLRYINGVLRHNARIKKGRITFRSEQPSVSVIICSKDESENLSKFLPEVLTQDYPLFEVIVINDGSSDDTEDLLKELKKTYKNLRSTFVPAEANNFSTKKLGLTLGIKAANFDWLLFTDADCKPQGKQWLANMARNFHPETEFVLGYGAYFSQKGLLNKLINYDTLFIALQYLGMAASKKPYMGVGRNMAYRKQTFFNQKGFASTLHLQSGDDDLMVNKAANGKNTSIEISPESITYSEPNKTFKGWFYQKERHLSVSSYYTPISKFRLGIEPITRGLFYLSFILSLCVGGLITLIAAGVLFLARYIVQLVVVNGSAKHFGTSKYYSTLLLFDIYLPLVSLYIYTTNSFSKSKTVRWK
jgi:cellulose synthase/poly-beta-1,6-N-acetylglucosamine synthase-like glycosyltransferase